MTTKKEKIADVLLCAAKHWQNENQRGDLCCGQDASTKAVLNDVWDDDDTLDSWCWDDIASAALSEAAALGFDLVDARMGR